MTDRIGDEEAAQSEPGTRDCGMMAIVDSNPSPAEQARLWVIKMDAGELCHKDRERLREWLRFSAENRTALREARKLWATLDDWSAQVQNTPGRFSALIKAADPAATPAYQWAQLVRARLRLANALAASVILGVFTLGLLQFAPPPEGRYETGRGEILTLQLDDGSTVTLNTGTSLDVAFSPQERRLVLRRGEVFSSVANDPRRPFVVHAGSGTVAALGTAFNVRKRADVVAVTVTEGVVAVSKGRRHSAVGAPPENTRQLTVNQSLQYGAALGEPALHEAREIEQSLAWRSGKLHFDDTRLEDFLAEVNRYSSKQLVVVDTDLKEIRVGGVFTAGDADGIVKALRASFALDMVGLTPTLTLLYKRDPE